MENEEKNIELIFKYLNDELSEQDKDIFNEKLTKDQLFAELFVDFKHLWELTDEKIDLEILDIDIEKEWNLFQKNISDKIELKTKIIDIKPKEKSSWKYIVSVAATIVVFIGLFFGINNSSKTINSETIVYTAQLPDNSEIVINRQSEIKYKRNFKKNRVLELRGDAYFKVEHDKEHPFIVQAGKYNIEVVGTEFYVNSDSTNFEVAVKKGVVKVYLANNPQKQIVLTAGEKTNMQENNLQKAPIINENYIAWKSHKIIIEDMSLLEIAKLLEKTYGVEIEISKSDLYNLKMTSTFDNQSLQSILKVVELTLGVKVVKQNENKYIVIK